MSVCQCQAAAHTFDVINLNLAERFCMYRVCAWCVHTRYVCGLDPPCSYPHNGAATLSMGLDAYQTSSYPLILTLTWNMSAHTTHTIHTLRYTGSDWSVVYSYCCSSLYLFIPSISPVRWGLECENESTETENVGQIEVAFVNTHFVLLSHFSGRKWWFIDSHPVDFPYSWKDKGIGRVTTCYQKLPPPPLASPPPRSAWHYFAHRGDDVIHIYWAERCT